jgi:hypothetical protein
MAKFRAAVVQDGTSRQGTSTTLEKAEALIAQCGSRAISFRVASRSTVRLFLTPLGRPRGRPVFMPIFQYLRIKYSAAPWS